MYRKRCPRRQRRARAAATNDRTAVAASAAAERAPVHRPRPSPPTQRAGQPAPRRSRHDRSIAGGGIGTEVGLDSRNNCRWDEVMRLVSCWIVMIMCCSCRVRMVMNELKCWLCMNLVCDTLMIEKLVSMCCVFSMFYVLLSNVSLCWACFGLHACVIHTVTCYLF